VQSFTFHNPTRIHFGTGQVTRLHREIPPDARVLLGYGGGSIFASGAHEAARAALGTRHVREFGGIEPNPDLATVVGMVETVRAERLDTLLAVGGGSVIDAMKLVAIAAPREGDPWDLVTRAARAGRALPLYTVLTLPATGSEMNHYSVISRRDTGEKRSFGDRLMFPVASVIDPTLMRTLPPRQVANGLADAFSHVLEQYLTYPVSAPLQDRWAEGVLHSLLEVAPRVMRDPGDPEAMGTFAWSATLALNGLLSAGVPTDWATHALAHELTALHGIDHGASLTILFPALLWHRREGKQEKLLQYGARVWGIDPRNGEESVREVVTRTRQFFQSLGLPTSLGAAGIGAEVADTVADRLAARGALPLGERKDLDARAVSEILRAAA
jgi:NADP-dependent alcohol dehydrogenase